MRTIVRFEPRLREVLEAFEEAIWLQGTNYSLDNLRRFGFDNEREIYSAVKRALVVSRTLGIDSRKHFRYVYRVDVQNNTVIREWKTSKLGFYLTMLNGRPSNPFTAAMQVELLQEFLSKLE